MTSCSASCAKRGQSDRGGEGLRAWWVCAGSHSAGSAAWVPEADEIGAAVGIDNPAMPCAS